MFLALNLPAFGSFLLSSIQTNSATRKRQVSLDNYDEIMCKCLWRRSDPHVCKLAINAGSRERFAGTSAYYLLKLQFQGEYDNIRFGDLNFLRKPFLFSLKLRLEVDMTAHKSKSIIKQLDLTSICQSNNGLFPTNNQQSHSYHESMSLVRRLNYKAYQQIKHKTHKHKHNPVRSSNQRDQTRFEPARRTRFPQWTTSSCASRSINRRQRKRCLATTIIYVGERKYNIVQQYN